MGEVFGESDARVAHVARCARDVMEAVTLAWTADMPTHVDLSAARARIDTFHACHHDAAIAAIAEMARRTYGTPERFRQDYASIVAALAVCEAE